MQIHRTAVIDAEARLAPDVRVGPYSIIGPGVAIGPGSEVGSHAIIERDTRLGERCRVHSHAVLGGDPQDLSYRGELTFCEIGRETVIREYVTINRGCHGEKTTRVGSHCMLMTGVHIAHDCQVGDHVIMANLATLAGHVSIGDGAVIGGLAAFHQFVRVGKLAMVGGTAGVMQDVPPFCMVQGAPPATVRGLNLLGLKRSGMSEAGIAALKHAFRLVYRRNMLREYALEEVLAGVEMTPEVQQFVEFMQAASKRGFCKGEPSGVLRVVGGEGEHAGQSGAEPQPGAARSPAGKG
jgi:UDP-N-acetylglucosamine acyltransferase